MILNLSDLSDEPLQGQIVRQVRAKILAGELAADSDLPSIRSLAREQQVSVITVQRAYESLVREGLIHSRRGKGFFVIPPRQFRDLLPDVHVHLHARRCYRLPPYIRSYMSRYSPVITRCHHERLSMYHRTVCSSPSSNATVGFHPSSRSSFPVSIA